MLVLTQLVCGRPKKTVGEVSYFSKQNNGNSEQKFIVFRANIFSGANTISSNKVL
jgi:hypothetical protein